MPIRQKITPHLWFDSNAEEAVAFYVALFPGSCITALARHPETGMGPPGTVMSIAFELAGQAFTAINGGPAFPLYPSISLFVDCDDQAEIDRLWAAFSAGGQAMRCGWIRDRFGLVWQVNTGILPALLTDGPPERAARVMAAMLTMERIDIAALEAAAAL